MDDRMLRDVGISRSEINSLIRRPVAGARGAETMRQRSAQRSKVFGTFSILASPGPAQGNFYIPSTHAPL